jgi:hypothetical protein
MKLLRAMAISALIAAAAIAFVVFVPVNLVRLVAWLQGTPL